MVDVFEIPGGTPSAAGAARREALCARDTRLKILTFASLYPNARQPQYAVFVENRLRHLVAGGQVEARVVAPVPWFPLAGAAFGRYSALAGVPRHEMRHGIEVEHPRFPVVPRVGMTLAPFLMYAWCRPALAAVLRSGYDFDLIDAHYFYPDGVAAVMLGRHFGKPVTITARGSDINVLPSYRVPRRLIRWAAAHAAGLITVSAALKEGLAGLGVARERIRVLRNGVDLQAFRPGDRDALRRKFEVRPPVLISVGNLLPAKGHDLAIRALPAIPQATLLIAGIGPDERRLSGLARDLRLEARVRFLGSVPHESMHELYGVADALVLASAREGWPNVLLEAMACGTPVVASDIPGVAEVVAGPSAGRLVARRDPEAIGEAIRALLADPPRRADTRAYAEGFSWDETTRGLLELFQEIRSRAQRP